MSYVIPSTGPTRQAWAGDDNEGVEWTVQVESDCFAPRLPVVVSLYVTDRDKDDPKSRDDALATPTPEQAREMAGVLLRCADAVEQQNVGTKGPGVRNDSVRVTAEVTIADCAQKIAVNDVPVLGSKTSFAFATMVMAAFDRAGLAVVAVGQKDQPA